MLAKRKTFLRKLAIASGIVVGGSVVAIVVVGLVVLALGNSYPLRQLV